MTTLSLVAGLLVVWYIAAGVFTWAGYPIALNRRISPRQAVFWPKWAAVALIVLLQVFSELGYGGAEP